MKNNNIIIILIIVSIILINKKYEIKEHYYYNTIIPYNNILNIIDKVYVIALPERKNYMKKVLKYYNINAEFIIPFLKNKLNIKKLINRKLLKKDYLDESRKAMKYSKNYSGINNGRIACHLSHMKALSYFLKSKNNNCIIFEDDIKMDDPGNKINKIKEIMDSVPDDWELINLGRCWDDCFRSIKINPLLVKAYSPKCRHAYIINRKGAKKILQYCLPIGGFPGDNLISYYIKKGIINCYASNNAIFLQNREVMGSNLNNKNQIMYECTKNTRHLL